MEFSEIWGFFKILSASIKIYLKNAKFITSITALSLLLSSILFLLCDFSYQFVTTYMANSITDDSTSAVIPILQILTSMALMLAVQLTFFKSYVAIGHATGIATTIAAAASYTDSKLSLPDLISAVKTNWKTPLLKNNPHRSVNPLFILCIIAVAVAVPAVMFYRNALTITIVSVGGVVIFVILLYGLYASVVPVVAAVIPLVEAGCEAAEAEEKAEKLVEGQRVRGFMVNLFVNVVGVIVCLGFWMIVGDKHKFNSTVYGLFFIDLALIVRIVLGVVYTVYYFRCKEYHSQQPFGDFSYTKLVTDIP